MSEERIAQESGDDAEDLGILDELLGIEPDEPDTGSQEQEPDDGDEGATADQPPPPPRRDGRTIRAIRAREQEHREEKARLQRQIDQLISQTRSPVALPPDPYRQAELNRQEQERLALMAPHEIAAYTEDKLRREWTQQRINDQVQIGDLIDRNTFETLKSRSKVAEKYAAQVETMLIELRQRGQNFPREVILKQIIGDEVMKKAGEQLETARRRGARQIAAQTTQPGAGRNGAADTRRTTRRNDPDAGLDERLRSVTVGDAW